MIMIRNTKKSERTKAKLKSILIDLCNEKSYQDVTVADICTRAETYRSTFYRYYDTKDAMLREIENEYVESAVRLTPSFTEFRKHLPEEEAARMRAELIEAMKFHQENRKLCMFLLSPWGDPYFSKKITETITETAENAMKKHGSPYSSDSKYILNFFANGYISSIYEWLRKDDRSAEQFADFLLKTMQLLLG